MRLLSRYGDGWLYPVFGLLIWIFNKEGAAFIIPAALIAFPIEILLQLALKFSFRRNRPCLDIPEVVGLVSLPEHYGFPSGHTAGAFVIATLIGTLYPGFLIPGYILGLLVGLSRIYNGVHYPGDVLAGVFLGIGAARLSLIILY